MPELSKTARASMGKQYKEVHVETTEEAIHAIRMNRAGGLHIGDMSRVDKLLAAYDKLMAEVCPPVVLADIPAQEEDPEHMKDFEK
jgi:hypothetical protein